MAEDLPKCEAYLEMCCSDEFLAITESMSEEAWDAFDKGNPSQCIYELTTNKHGCDLDSLAKWGFPNLALHENAVEFMNYINEYGY